MSRKCLLAILIAITLSIACSIRIALLNSDSPSPECVEYPIGSSVDVTANLENDPHQSDAITVTVNSFSIEDGPGSEIAEDSEYVDPFLQSGVVDATKTALVAATFDNTSESNIEIGLQNFYLVSGSWSSVLNPLLYEALEGSEDPTIKLAPGEKVDVIIPFSIYNTQFSESISWESIEQRSFELRLERFPKRLSVPLKEDVL